jgi:hypothetical protein
MMIRKGYPSVVTPLWSKCENETHIPKSGNLESCGTPENSVLDCMGQNTSHWGVLYTVVKVFKCRCPKWPCTSHLDICSTNYGRKKGRFPTTKSRESTRSRCVQVECNTPLKNSWGELQLCFRPHPNRRSELGVMTSQSPKSPNWNNFGTPPWESWDKKSFGCRSCERTQRTLYGGRWWLPPSLGYGESNESVLLVACPNSKVDPEWKLTHLWLVFDAGLSS